MNVTREPGSRPAGPEVALLPVGSQEQHGPHLPLDTDTLIATTVAEELARAYSVRLLPPIAYSCSHEHDAWPGTVSISATTLSALVSDIAASLRRAGTSRLVLVNGHGGNYVLGNVVQESSGRMALFPGVAEWEAARRTAGVETSGEVDMHAGELETSLLLHARPDVVARGFEARDELTGDRPHLLTRGLAAYSASGVVGRPSLASANKGRLVLGDLVRSFSGHLTALGVTSPVPGEHAPEQ
ncbi:creatininase family protein [Spiractinospora alimapuensis]|uniref:creatininase family protein n=1 Tax=Spiractinospora alimapuensis TaxID=2820884 RepID=UPI001F1E7058|nr:creatininase family protein [Spiractinospora alimapuensis]